MAQSTVRNHLLAALPRTDLARLWPKLHPVGLETSAILHVAQAPIEYVYFCETGWVSMIADFANGTRAEVGLIGHEGVVGLPLALGIETASNEAMVQGSGVALSMEAHLFRQALDEVPLLRAQVLRFNEAMHVQVSQTAACNGHHSLEARLIRWLLMAHDRTEGDQLALTHEFLALMLCVHRPSVTIAARLLQSAGLIRYTNGSVTVIDRPGLEAACCECYAAVRHQYHRLLGGPCDQLMSGSIQRGC